MHPSVHHESSAAGGLKSGCVAALAVALTVLVWMPCFVPTTPVRYFESDPRLAVDGLSEAALTELGPAGVAWLQTITAAVAALSLAVAIWAGSRLSRAAVGLAALGMVAVVFHMTKDAARWEDWTQGGAWIAAATTGVAAMHLARHEIARRWIVGLSVAAALPLLAEAGWYVWVEHPVTVTHFEANRDAILALRGMLPGSEAATLFERRLRFADATGTFGLSNVLASVAAMLGLLSAGVLLAMRRRGEISVWIMGLVAAGVAAVGALTVVMLTASKGAAVAGVMVGCLAICIVILGRWKTARRWMAWALPAAALGLVALALGAVLVRGAMGPPPPTAGGFVAGAEIQGERSLLFRAHYWSAAARIAAQHPVLGSGPRGFADAYPAVKNPLNPESVTSTHNVLIDQITMLGVGGWAWAGLLLWWLWQAGRGFGRSEEESAQVDEASHGPGQETGVQRTAVWTAVVAAMVLFGLTLWVRQSSLYLDTAGLWLAAMAGFVAVAAVLGSAGVVSIRSQRLGLFLAATVVLVHNQIEMAFFQPTSMGLLWLIVGAAGAGAGRMRPASISPEKQATPTRFGPLGQGLAAGAMGIIVVVVMGVYAGGAARHEQALRGAEAALKRGDVALAESRLAEAQHAAGFDTQTLRWRVQLTALEPMPHLVAAGRTPEARQRLNAALDWINDAAAWTGDTPIAVARLRAGLLGQEFELIGGDDFYGRAERAAEALAELSPYNIQDRLAWADLAWRAGQRELARRRYTEVLDLREQKYLDPADPLSPEQLARVRAALESAE